MQVKALKTFNGPRGLVRTGFVVTVDDRYGAQLIQLGLVARFKPPIGPELDMSLPGPDSTKAEQGNGVGDLDPESSPVSHGSEDDSSEDPQAGGSEPLSSAQLRGRRSRKKTSTTSRGKRG